ncbi:MAG: DegT/DnrJ/EryC1/StrS family aminotransferase [Anaerolinea sp.]|nr:DegT/DnrJ/EryC1/StrS family aminotransferase [Anaerolinea sp.]
MQLPIPQANPKAAYANLRAEIDSAVHHVLDSGWYLQGEQVSAFEAEFAAWTHLKHVIGVGNGTDALELALRALRIGVGAEVIVPAHTATATIAAIELAGATPVLVDIDPALYTIDPEKAARAITNRTRAIMPVHLYGHPAALDSLLPLAQAHQLAVIEDCAQAHGARFQGTRVGSMGTAAAFSFYPTKNLGALGDGGAVGCQDSALAEQMRVVAQYGWRQRYISDDVGMNTRLDELQAAVLRCKLRVLDAATERRRAIAARYTQALAGHVVTPREQLGCEHVYHLYVIRSAQRDSLRHYLNEHQIATAVHYPLPIHLQPAYRGRLGDLGDFPQAERACSEIISLPLYPEMTDDQVDYVIETLLARDA